MTFAEMMTHCKAGGKARRTAWRSNFRVFIEGLRLSVKGSLATTGEPFTSEYTATMQDKAATDWERA